MTQKLKIDFVSDVACPWCVIGLLGLEKALDNVAGEIDADIAFHPVELNPDLPSGGKNGLEHIAGKYGMSFDRVRENRATICHRAAKVGFTINTLDASRIYNTFDAHRLIAWAGEKGRQLAMKQHVFALYFTQQKDPGDPDALANAAHAAGLNATEAREVLAVELH